ncbi:ABC transporter permease [Arundinibacter roseus]|uniref:FtsX-like permease family protein n=1 Tax=Arundinibacter roseus TaxID=2070510 RepID=A0A4R4K5K9_9BACT|nr:ABC transporter permease [Arundinibacter roseus]TDB62738.1 FtsX-like permease family protein [Arundinibacter roseus]
MIRNYLKIAWRNLTRNTLYSTINCVGLAVGLAACMAISLYVWDEYQYDRAVPHFEQTYRVTERQKQATGLYDLAVTPGPLAPALKDDFPEITETVRLGAWSGLLQYQQTAVEPEAMRVVDASFLSFFGFKLLKGNPQTVLSSPDEIVISEAVAERFFGKDWRAQSVLGKTIHYNQERPLRLSGIVENSPARSHIQFDVLLPLKYFELNDKWSYNWGSNNYHTYLKIRPDTDIASFSQKLAGQLKKYDKDNETPLLLQPLREIHLYSDFDFGTDWGIHGNIRYIRIFVLVGLIILLIALFNFINLSTARATQRAREVGVRKSVGALRSSLIVQFWGESLLMTSIALGVGLVLLNLLMPFFNELSGKVMVVPFQQPLFWASMVGVLLFISFLTGLYPAFYLSSFRPVRVLKGIYDKKSGAGFRKTLVVTQFVMSIVLIIGTVGLFQQLQFIQDKKLGFDKEQLLYVRLKGNVREKSLTLKELLTKQSSIASVSATTSTLVNMQNTSYIEWAGKTPNDDFLITQMNVDADFLKTTGMALAAGRNFSTAIASDTSSKFGTYLINETAARRMGWTPQKALGKKVNFWGLDGTIVGVLRDFHFRPMNVKIEPFIVRFRPKESYFNLLVKTRPNETQRALADIAQLYKKFEPNQPFSYGFVNEDLERQYAVEQRTGQLLLCFSILAILISCLGLFGLATFTAEQRIKEIGIRKVMGASIANITGLLSKDFIKLVLIANGIAFPLAYYGLNHWLQDFEYRIGIEWWIFALAGIMAIGISLVTVSFQAIKAALMNPVKSLRSE